MRKIVTEDWIPFLLEHNLANLTIHGRTVSEMSKVPAHWDEIGKAVQIRNEMGVDTPIVGNGDILTYQQGIEMHEQYGVDGIMIGRGIFHNFWIFDPKTDPTTFNKQDRLTLLSEHIQLWDQTWAQTKDFNVLKKFYKVYINGFDGASDLRMHLMQFTTAQETLEFLNSIQ
jgi:tRNA-dihydrouridine synthase